MGNSQGAPQQPPNRQGQPPIPILRKPQPSTIERAPAVEANPPAAATPSKPSEKQTPPNHGSSGPLGLGKILPNRKRNSKRRRSQRAQQGDKQEREPSETISSQHSRNSVSENATTEDRTVDKSVDKSVDTVENVPKEKEKVVKPGEKEKVEEKEKPKDDKPPEKTGEKDKEKDFKPINNFKKKRGKLSNQLPKEERTEFERIKVKTRPAKSRKNAAAAGAKNLERLMSKQNQDEDDPNSPQLVSFDEEEKQKAQEKAIEKVQPPSDEAKQSFDSNVESADESKDTSLIPADVKK